ncbi:thiol:disulfide interchange protein [Serpentinimonas raichei]|uniref:Thiol:disulfide interchange protein n=2 Tax=Serpentinimonas raichei TaxID=1458425 RepID=A0A060NH80_9BURK|nr:thiol:disulfide interchange protein [Serpentinimonas raichei]
MFTLLRMFKIFWVFLLGACLGLGVPLAGAQVSAPVLTPESRTSLLVHAPQGVAPGQPLWLGLQIEHAPGWHSYWKNPGDSGLPTEFEWQLPGHVVPGAIAWPTPRKFPLGELANYGYKDTVLLPIPLEVRPGFAAAALELEVLATWLICREECIPQEARFQVRIPAQMATVAHAAAFEAAWGARPVALPAGASQLVVGEQALQATLHGLPAAWQGRALEFFPEIGALIQPGAAWQQRWEGGVWHASIPLNPFRSASPEQLPLVLALADPPPGAAGVRMELPVPGGWPAVAAPTGVSDALAAALAAEAARAAAPAPGLTLWAALLGALIGGMILNLMPCVFPVLALKVLSFSQHAQDRRRLRLGGLAYTAGVVLSFLALGALLLGLRAAGEQLGWGFQLQNPAVVAALAALFTLIGLNLAGLFQFGPMLPSALASLRVRNPNADSFLTGVLATAVASPCTAPFMGAALGLAVTLAPAQALAVFAALGLGMALPYLAATWVPALVRALPRPGAWMETLRQWLAFPMLATVVWLLWVLGHQGGIDAAAGLLMLLLLLAWLLWAVGRGGLMRRWMAPLALLALLGGLWLLGPMLHAQPSTSNTSSSAGAERGTPTAVAGLYWEAWSPQREAELLAQGRTVFIDYTAAWCVSCLYNKHNALADERFLQDVAARKVVLLRADWTLRDPAVTASLARLGRNSIPVYVLHAPGRAPLLLSEILTVEELRAALAQL